MVRCFARARGFSRDQYAEYKNNKFKISAPTWNDIFDLSDGSYSIADIEDYFVFMIKKHETFTENPSVQIYPNGIKNRIVFKIKTGYKLELLTLGTMKLLGSTKKDVDKDKNGETVPKLETTKVVLVHCNLVKSDYQHTSRVLFSFVPSKQFGQLINVSPHSSTMMNTVNTEFSFLEVWFTDQARRALEIEDNVNLTLIIGQSLQKLDIQQNQDLENTLKDAAFCHLLENLVINMVKD